MIATATALLLAHTLADFLFQTNWMVREKTRPEVFALHIAVTGALSLAALGFIGWQAALAVTAAHGVIDALKTWALPAARRATLTAFSLDQLAHLASIAAVALWWPTAAASGLWAPWLPLLLPPALVTAGLVLCVWAGGHAIGLLMQRYAAEALPEGLPDAGRLIGQLERAMIFLLVLIDQPAGIGFLIAAKSILRFDTASKGQKTGEYVIIGTLASFAWALAIATATRQALPLL